MDDRLEYRRQTGDWWTGESFATDRFDVLRRIFSAAWATDEMRTPPGPQELAAHPLRYVLINRLPFAERTIEYLADLTSQFASAPGFERIAFGLRSRQDYLHARNCLEAAAIVTGGMSAEVSFEQAGAEHPDRPHDVTLRHEDGRRTVIEVKCARVPESAQTVYDFLWFITLHYSTAPELLGCFFELHRPAVDGLRFGRISRAALLDEVRRVARRTRIGRSISTRLFEVRRAARSGGSSGGGPRVVSDEEANRLFRRNGLLGSAFAQLPDDATSIIAFEPHVVRALGPDFVSTFETRAASKPKLAGMLMMFRGHDANGFGLPNAFYEFLPNPKWGEVSCVS